MHTTRNRLLLDAIGQHPHLDHLERRTEPARLQHINSPYGAACLADLACWGRTIIRAESKA